MAFGNRLIGLGAPATPQVGEAFGGGVIFWLDGNGGGMVASLTVSNSQMSTCTNNNVAGTSTAFGTGAANTALLYANTSCGISGATISANATTSTENGYSDWFAPSRDEFTLMHSIVGPGSTLGNLANFVAGNGTHYWSSSALSYALQNGWRVTSYTNGTTSLSNQSPQNYYYWFKKVRRFLSFDEPFIGQLREGGIVFYINPASGFGYVVSLDIFRKRWGTTQPVYYYQMNNDNNSIGASESNTAAGLAFFGASNNTHIFYDADNYTYDGYSDWVIPSFNLAKEWWNNRSIVDAAISTNGGSPRTTGGFLTSGGRSETKVNAVAWSTGNNYTLNFTALNFETRFVRKFTY